MSERRDIFLVCDDLSGEGDGGDPGARPAVYRLGELFAGRGHQVRLIAVTGRGGRPEPGSQVTVLTGRPRAGRRAASRLGAILRSARPGAVLVVTGPAACEMAGRAQSGGIPIVAVTRVPYAVAEGSPEYDRMLREFGRADRFLALTREDADSWARAGLSNADVLPDWHDPAPAVPAEGGGQVVLGPSALIHAKGADLLLESWSRVAPHRPDWRLVLRGDGPEQPELRRLASELGIEGSVEFAPPAADPRAALAEAAIFALPSRAEVFPAGLLAAMGHGLPVVAFDCSPAVREMVTDEADGLLVDPGHTEQFALALERLIADEGLREKLGRSARESAALFGSENIAARWDRLFALLFR